VTRKKEYPRLYHEIEKSKTYLEVCKILNMSAWNHSVKFTTEYV